MTLIVGDAFVSQGLGVVGTVFKVCVDLNCCFVNNLLSCFRNIIVWILIIGGILHNLHKNINIVVVFYEGRRLFCTISYLLSTGTKNLCYGIQTVRVEVLALV